MSGQPCLLKEHDRIARHLDFLRGRIGAEHDALSGIRPSNREEARMVLVRKVVKARQAVPYLDRQQRIPGITTEPELVHIIPVPQAENLIQRSIVLCLMCPPKVFDPHDPDIGSRSASDRTGHRVI